MGRRFPVVGSLLRVAGFAVVACAALLSAQSGPARDLQLENAGPARIALVIGNDRYPSSPLRQAVNDAKDVGEGLRDVGFDVQIVTDTQLREMDRAITGFVEKIHKGDVAVFFYAGHGFQIAGENYLVPVDFETTDEADAKYRAYSASRIQERMEFAGARLSVVVLDACRNNPFLRARSGGDGLAAMNAGRGTFLALATGPGKRAFESASGRNSIFTESLLTALGEPGLSLEQVFNRVRERVYDKSQGQQLPWTSSSVIGEFFFRPPVAASKTTPTSPPVVESTASPSAIPLQEPGTAMPRVIYKVQPTVPKDQPRGYAKLSMTVDVDGTTKDIAVVQATSEAHSKAATDAVKLWRFEPARKGDRPVPMTATTEITFSALAQSLRDGLAPQGLARIGDSGVAAPVILHKVMPDYPEEARKLKKGFYLCLYAEIDESGQPREVKPLGSIEASSQKEGEALTDLMRRATTALQQWRFRPAERTGRAVRVAASFEFRFVRRGSRFPDLGADFVEDVR